MIDFDQNVIFFIQILKYLPGCKISCKFLLTSDLTRTFSQVPDYCRSLDEQTICKQAFDLIFAFDEVVAMGYKEKVTVQQVKQFIQMDSQEEKIFEMIQRVSI